MRTLYLDVCTWRVHFYKLKVISTWVFSSWGAEVGGQGKSCYSVFFFRICHIILKVQISFPQYKKEEVSSPYLFVISRKVQLFLKFVQIITAMEIARILKTLFTFWLSSLCAKYIPLVTRLQLISEKFNFYYMNE